MVRGRSDSMERHRGKRDSSSTLAPKAPFRIAVGESSLDRGVADESVT